MRIDIETLGEELRDAIERGEPVEVERAGTVIGRFEPVFDATIAKWVESFDTPFGEPEVETTEEDLDLVRQLLNTPGEQPTRE